MFSANEFYYGIDCPAEKPSVTCECGEKLLEFGSIQYYDKNTGCAIGCGECLDENENDGRYICECKNFNDKTETIYTGHGNDFVAGCSECVKKRFSGFVE